MTNPIQETFEDAVYCMKQVKECRVAVQRGGLTKTQYEAIEKTLGLMYIHCPEPVKETVLRTLEFVGYEKPIEFII